LVAPWARISPARSAGTQSPATTVIINDRDRSDYATWCDNSQKNRNAFWEDIAKGSQLLLMDP
jgi:hypothetical protein